MYLVFDDFSNYEGQLNYKQLKEFYISEVVRDLVDNTSEREIVISCTKELESLAKNNNIDEKDLIDKLKSYGWTVLNLYDLKHNLYVLRDYKYNCTMDKEMVENLDNIIKQLEKGVE